jgi:cytochrome c5
MRDDGFEHAHSSPIKTPQQLVVVLVLAFVIPVIGIILLTQFITRSKQPDPATLASDAVAARIQPVARVEISDAPAGPRAAKTGEEVYKSVCTTCHGPGVAGAPKTGDKGGWSKHIAEGLETMVKNAINGIRAMPPRGGNPELSDYEVARAVVFMANQSGGSFKEPPPPKEGAAPPPATATAPAAPPAPVPIPPPPAAGAQADAGSPDQLLQKYGCLACHAADKKVVGPSYKEVATKYAPDKEAPTKLAQKVKSGGAGNWGQVPMPPHPQVSDADIQTMVKHILAQK